MFRLIESLKNYLLYYYKQIPYTMISLKSIVGEVRREDLLEEWEKKKAVLVS